MPELDDVEELSPRDRAVASRHGQMDYDPNDDDVVISDSDDVVIPEPDEPEMVEVKVNGQTRMVEQTKIDDGGGLETYQKQLAANEGLQSLSNERKLFKQEQEQLVKQQEQFAVKQSLSVQDGIKETPATNVPSSDERKQLVKQYHQAIDRKSVV